MVNFMTKSSAARSARTRANTLMIRTNRPAIDPRRSGSQPLNRPLTSFLISNPSICAATWAYSARLITQTYSR